MSTAALRAVMELAARGRDEEIGTAFFELLAAAPVRVLEDGARLTRLEGGQLALPVFLDDAALARWAPGAAARTCSVQAAAQQALEHAGGVAHD